MLWTLVPIVAVLGAVVLAVLGARVRREIPPARDAFDRLHRDLRPALVELHDETERLAAELRRRGREG